MLILLPPSEGKAAPGEGSPIKLGDLSLPKLRPARRQVFDALIALCRPRDDEPARAVLGLSPGQRDEVRLNAGLRKAAAMPAGSVYTGVVYDALELSSLPPAALAQAERSILISSGLWGAVRITDLIPPYRCPIGVNLPGVGPLGSFWRQAMSGVMAKTAAAGLVLDLRSSGYATMWQPVPAAAAQVAAVRVLHERTVDGVTKRSVVSHFNKATKGRLVRDLLIAGVEPTTPQDLIAALRDLKHTVEATTPSAGKPWLIDLVVPEL
ncbi:cytoplasmic iron level regulating protein YaaA (DUF328/UPF0246 family) [Allocatelliglobosispora scoriae]|uniref:Cytoplasmic iron level regulating protein YaaA (DUF328/UPF0246 family) n=1 Tax=Allocatelliglobosispora scoriae TaxID=643052 RepID=A0A841BRQ3_9ACTN|nr:peroxide stress protein YaaA [Allocatelliglobosispora scoriae]MBB5869879.1 cytoplasmic iron level regulating protein YaaA (DUF328/UPF0246 family) [Allocatelliglobosispora scoriae]